MKIKTKPLLRSVSFGEDSSVDLEKREATFPFSSEFPVEREFWSQEFGYEVGYEVLDHSPGCVDLGRLNDGGAIRDGHDGDQIGDVISAFTKDRRNWINGRYSCSDRATVILTDMSNGLRRNVSCKYKVLQFVREAPKEEGGKPTYRAKKWYVTHVSHEPDAADPTVGLNRSLEDQEIETELIRSESETPTIITKEEVRMDPKEIEAMQERHKIELQQATETARKSEAHRVAQLRAMEDIYGHVEGVRDIIGKGIKEGTAYEEVGASVLNKVGEKRSAMENHDPKSLLGIPDKELKGYSFARALKMQAGLCKKDGVEFEAHKALEERGISAKQGGILIPFDVQSRKTLGSASQERSNNAGSGSAGGYLVSTSPMGFIDMLRNSQVMTQLGVSRLSGLKGNVYIPRKTGALTTYWVNEDTAATESAMTFGQVLAMPKTVSGWCRLTRDLLKQSDPSIEQLAMTDLAEGLGIASDAVALNGIGGAGQPLGVLNVSGVGSFTATTWRGILGARTDIRTANALTGNIKWLMTPAVMEIMMSTEKSTGYPVYLMNEETSKMAGYLGLDSNQVPSGYMGLADWSQLLLCDWGTLEVKLKDADDHTGAMFVEGFLDMDVVVRQTGAFTFASSIS
jgi:HK97 family phage major capsid protein